MARPEEGDDAELAELLAAQARFLSGGEAPAATARRAAAAAPRHAAPPPSAQPAASTRAAHAFVTSAAADAAPRGAFGGGGATPLASTTLGVNDAGGPMDDLSGLDELPSRPAATAVRMPRRGAPSGGAAAAPRVREPPQPPLPGGPDDASSAQVLGSVLERNTGAPCAPAPPRAPAPRGAGGAAPSAPRLRFAPAQPPAPAPAAAAQAEPLGGEAAARAAEVAARLAGMSAAEIAEAQQELTQRLGADKLAFLKARGARGGGGGSAAASAPSARGVAASFAPPCAPLPSLPAPPAQAGLPASGPACVRFALDGALLPPQRAAAPGEALRRDPLRTEGNPSAGGYTLREAAHLARSAVPAQRVAALRLLAAALQRIAQCMASATSAAAQGLALPQAGPAPGVTWAALWVHAVKDAQMPLLLRTALDDGVPAVAAAAAAAIAALVAPTPAEACAWEAWVDSAACEADAVPPAAPHWRARAGAPWEPVAPPAEGAEEGLPNEGVEGSDGDAVDPLSALLRMQFAHRARFLLEAARNGPAAAPLLRALLAAARHCATSAESVAATPRLLEALSDAFLHAEPPAQPDGRVGVPGAEAGADVEFWRARPAALRLLRALARASPAAARAVAASGAVSAAALRFAPLPSEGFAAASDAAADGSAELRREALRLWAAAAAAGAPVPSVPAADSLMPVLCAALHPPCDAAPSAAWEASAGVFAVMCPLAQRAALGDTAAMSPAAAAAVADAAAAWLAPPALRAAMCATGPARAPALCAFAAALRYITAVAPLAVAAAAAAELARHALAAAAAAGNAAAPSAFSGMLSAAAHGDDEDVAAAALAAARACVALLRRASSASDGDAGATAAACDAAARTLAVLTPSLAALGAAEEAKDTWQPAPGRARAAALVAAVAEALCAAAQAGPPQAAHADVALLLLAAAPPGSEALCAAALAAAVTSADAAAALLPAAAAAAAAAARAQGSASAEEASAEDDDVATGGGAWGALTAQPPSVPPALRAALRGRLCSAAGVPAAAPPPPRGAPCYATADAAASRLPLPRDWALRAAAQPPSAAEWAFVESGARDSQDDDARVAVAAADAGMAAPLALALAMEAAGGAACPLVAAPAAAKLRLLCAALAAAPDGVLRDVAARRCMAALLDRYAAALRDEAAAAALGGGSRANASGVDGDGDGDGDDDDPRAAAEAATALCESLADASFGDALHARAAALCLRARAPRAARVAALRALIERRATHLLPSADAFAFPAGVRAAAVDAMFFPSWRSPNEDDEDDGGGAELFSLWADFACDHRAFGRAADANALPAALAEHALRCAGEAARAGEGGTRRSARLQAVLQRVAEHGATTPARIARTALEAAEQRAAAV